MGKIFVFCSWVKRNCVVNEPIWPLWWPCYVWWEALVVYHIVLSVLYFTMYYMFGRRIWFSVFVYDMTWHNQQKSIYSIQHMRKMNWFLVNCSCIGDLLRWKSVKAVFLFFNCILRYQLQQLRDSLRISSAIWSLFSTSDLFKKQNTGANVMQDAKTTSEIQISPEFLLVYNILNMT